VAGNGLSGYTGDGGPATQARLRLPQAIAVHPGGDLIIADAGNNVLRRVDHLTGTISTLGTEHGEPLITSWNVPPSP